MSGPFACLRGDYSWEHCYHAASDLVLTFPGWDTRGRASCSFSPSGSISLKFNLIFPKLQLKATEKCPVAGRKELLLLLLSAASLLLCQGLAFCMHKSLGRGSGAREFWGGGEFGWKKVPIYSSDRQLASFLLLV